ncbi:hypothetical protein WB794_11590 [Denitratimonas tolerans]|uniref:TonB C-terminal domain-containing protein n=2 Tax=Denitratimonas tolerans TaxID=1338420 RepID=A0AAW9RCA8_9GAMM
MKVAAVCRVFFLVVLALTGCASLKPQASGEVSLASLEPPDAERHALSSGEDFRMGTPIAEDARAMPPYPAKWLERAPVRLEVCVEITVGERGEVESSRPLRDAPGCGMIEGEMARDFDAAVAQTVRTWRYMPSLLCRLVPGAEADGSCGNALERAPVPVLRAYRFVFERRAGAVHVGVSEADDR